MRRHGSKLGRGVYFAEDPVPRPGFFLGCRADPDPLVQRIPSIDGITVTETPLYWTSMVQYAQISISTKWGPLDSQVGL